MAVSPGIDHLVGQHDQRRNQGSQQHGGQRPGRVEVAPNVHDRGSNRLSPGNTRVFYRIVDVYKAGHGEFLYLKHWNKCS